MQWYNSSTANRPINDMFLKKKTKLFRLEVKTRMLYLMTVLFLNQGFEAVQVKLDETNYRLVLSDGIHMNSYFFLCCQLNDLIVKKQVKYGTILRIDEYKFINGENSTDHSPRLIE